LNNAESFSTEVRPFLWVAVGWLLGALAFCALRTAGDGTALLWLVAIWALAMADLAAMVAAIRAVFRLNSVSSEKRPAAAIQALTWGSVKLACLGLFIAIFVNSATLPVVSLLLGLGTMICVPVVGGFWWSQRILKHA
jgi:hypothetical protein